MDGQNANTTATEVNAAEATQAMPIVTLTNGIRIGNFSSPHAFTFTDGTVLPACAPERVMMSSLESRENLSPFMNGAQNVELEFELSPGCLAALSEADRCQDVDVILVPFPVLEALRQRNIELADTKYRVVRMADRVTKTACHDKFCI